MDPSRQTNNSPALSEFDISPSHEENPCEFSPPLSPPFPTTAYIQAFNKIATRGQEAEEAWRRVAVLRERRIQMTQRLAEITREEQQATSRALALNKSFWREAFFERLNSAPW